MLGEGNLRGVLVPWGEDALLKASGPSNCLQGILPVPPDKFWYKNYQQQKQPLAMSLSDAAQWGTLSMFQ